MSWFRVDDKFHSHPKVKGLKAVDPLGLWTLCGSYCSDHPKLDGVVPLHVAADFVGNETRAKAIAAKLVARGLWSVTEDGWRFHDWHEYQPSAEEADGRRSSLSAKRSSAGRIGADRRWHKPSDANGNVMANVDGNPDGKMATDSPVPSRPVPSQEGEPSRAIAIGPETSFPMPDEFPLTDEARSAAAMVGVRDIDDEWTRFRAHHIKAGDVATARGWYAGAWTKWFTRSKWYQARDRSHDEFPSGGPVKVPVSPSSLPIFPKAGAKP